MFADNKTTYIKREIMTYVADVFFEQNIHEANRIPIKTIKREDTPNRCCIAKDREIVKSRAIAIMGFDINQKEAEDKLLSDYAEIANNREKPDGSILTFLESACQACVKVNYYVTDMCKNCVAKPCILNCPKGAISTINNHANIDKDSCVNCGICQKVCPYHAIIYVPVPCEESCPVGAIQKNEDGNEYIDYSKCIYCGKCIKSCPFGAVAEKTQIPDVIKVLKGEKKVAALVAPAITGQFPGDTLQTVAALKALGFDHVVEVALGADDTVKHEASEFAEKIKEDGDVLGTSCCPSYIEAVKKHAPNFLEKVSSTKTPLHYTAKKAKERFEDCITVFIGPCIAKKHEGFNDEFVDFVMTFEELGAMFISRKIDVLDYKPVQFDNEKVTKEARLFPVSGGVANAVKNYAESNFEDAATVKPVLINGITKKNLVLLNHYAKGCKQGNLIEVMSCEGGCIAGPGVIGNPKLSENSIKDFADKK